MCFKRREYPAFHPVHPTAEDSRVISAAIEDARRSGRAVSSNDHEPRLSFGEVQHWAAAYGMEVISDYRGGHSFVVAVREPDGAWPRTSLVHKTVYREVDREVIGRILPFRLMVLLDWHSIQYSYYYNEYYTNG